MSHSDNGLYNNGITVRFLDVFFIVLSAIVFFFLLIILCTVNNRFNSIKTTMDKFIIYEKSAVLIKESSNYLTDRARLFVITHKENYVTEYLNELNETKRQQKAIEALSMVCCEKDLSFQCLKIAIEQSKSLINMELYAIRLAYTLIPDKKMPAQISEIQIRSVDKNLSNEELKKRTVDNLFGDAYLVYKTRINENCRITLESLENQIHYEVNTNISDLAKSLTRLKIIYVILLLLTISSFIVFLYSIVIPLRKYKKSIEKEEKLELLGIDELKYFAEKYNEIYLAKIKNEKDLITKNDYDELTGLLNYTAFEKICRISTKKKIPIALLLINMDNFKNINDNYGKSGGDLALKEVARLLTETFRTDDYISRIDGDEFSVILPNCSAAATSTIKQKILSINEKLVNIKDNIKAVSISVGVAFSNEGYNEELLNKASKALYIVKEKGKRGCEVYEETSGR